MIGALRWLTYINVSEMALHELTLFADPVL